MQSLLSIAIRLSLVLACLTAVQAQDQKPFTVGTATAAQGQKATVTDYVGQGHL